MQMYDKAFDHAENMNSYEAYCAAKAGTVEPPKPFTSWLFDIGCAHYARQKYPAIPLEDSMLLVHRDIAVSLGTSVQGCCGGGAVK